MEGMPIPERVNVPRPDAELLRFIDRRRQQQARRRRKLFIVGTAAAASVVVLALVVAGWLLGRRSPSAPAPGTVATAPPASPEPASKPATPRADGPAPIAPSPGGETVTPPSADTVVPPRGESAAPPRSDTAPPPTASQPSVGATDAERAAPSTPAPPRAATRAERSRPTPPAIEPTRPTRSPAATGSVQRTATWLVQTYGRLEAENRAAVVAEFYSGERRAFWQRVLAEVRRTPEP
jgi:hypothetical protein